MVTLEERRRRLVGTCMVLGPLVMLAADLMLRAGRFEWLGRLVLAGTADATAPAAPAAPQPA